VRRFFAIPALFMALVLGGGLGAIGSAGLPRLQVATPFVVLGTSAIFTITGEPGASYTLFLSRQPAEVPAGQLGTLFLKQGTATPIAEGTLSGAGAATAELPVPDTPTMNGVVLYTQALVTAGGVSRLTNAVPFRAQSQPPAGGRAPRALAVTPDGTKAYTANQLDGTVSVVDLVTQTKLADLPVGPSARAIPYRPLDIAIDPEGRHVFVANVASGTLMVIDVATDSVAGQIPVSKGCRRIAFHFAGGARRIYVTNDVLNALLVIDETAPGVYVAGTPIPLLGRGPGPVAILPDGRLVVGHRVTLELELVDPAGAPGSTTVGRVTLGTQPLDVVVSGDEALVPAFQPVSTEQNGFNQVWRVDLSTLQVTGFLFPNAGTDYNAAAVSGSIIAIAGSGSGTAVIGDLATGALLDTVDLVPGGIDPHGTPQDVAFGPPAGAPARAYVVDQFRETVRFVALSAGPPFAVGPEIPLAHSGAPRVPLTADLSAFESGDYLMRSGHFFNATAANPNPVTCQTCHTDGASDNVKRVSGREPLPLFNLGNTAPYNWQGNGTDLLVLIRGAFTVHGEIGGPIADNADLKLLGFFQAFMPPTSVHLLPGGALGADAQAGKALFEGAGQCTTCHAAPHFLPPPGQPLTIAAGVGTGLAPINVPGLRAAWATPPYFHDGSARRLQDVFFVKPGDVHNNLTSGFTAEQIRQLVAYLNAL
jgi:YVTN family beta-propeller protein